MEFRAMAGARSVTENCQVGSRSFNDRHLVVVDTPGFFDNRDIDERTTCINIGQSLQATVPGPHAFLIVLPLARITNEVEREWEWITKIFGERALNYCIIVFTHEDELIADGITVEQFLQNRTSSLATLIETCGERYVAFNNYASLEEKNRKTQQLLDLIDDMIRKNGNQVFKDKVTEDINKVVEEEKKNGDFDPIRSDGAIISLPQTEKIVVEAYMQKLLAQKCVSISYSTTNSIFICKRLCVNIEIYHCNIK
jgi:hypothetical protein